MKQHYLGWGWRRCVHQASSSLAFWGWKSNMHTWQAVKNQQNMGGGIKDEFTENKSQIFNNTSQSILWPPSGNCSYFSCWDTIALNSFVSLRDSWVRKLFKNTNSSLMNGFNISVNLTHFMNPNIPKDSWQFTSVFPKHSLAYNHLDNLVKHLFPDRKVWNKNPGISIFNKQSRSFLCSQTERQG